MSRNSLNILQLQHSKVYMANAPGSSRVLSKKLSRWPHTQSAISTYDELLDDSFFETILRSTSLSH